MAEILHDVEELRKFGTDLLENAGMESGRAGIVSDILVEGDLLGHTTHGLQLLEPYLKSIESGATRLEGEPEIMSAKPVAGLWAEQYRVAPPELCN